METKIIKRTFEAAKYPKGSKEREELNSKAETSEYYTSKKYLAIIIFPETETHLQITRKQVFATKRECEDFISSKTGG